MCSITITASISRFSICHKAGFPPCFERSKARRWTPTLPWRGPTIQLRIHSRQQKVVHHHWGRLWSFLDFFFPESSCSPAELHLVLSHLTTINTELFHNNPRAKKTSFHPTALLWTLRMNRAGRFDTEQKHGKTDSSLHPWLTAAIYTHTYTQPESRLGSSATNDLNMAL